MKKKLLTLGLSSTLALSSIMPAFANSIPSETNTKDSYIETNIGFKYPETMDDLKDKNLRLSLKQGEDEVFGLSLNDILSSSNKTKTLNNVQVESNVTIENGKVKLIKLTIKDLNPNDYELTITGDKYIQVIEDVNTKNFSKKVNINMFIGDVNNDGIIDTKDRSLLEENIDSDNTEYDLNGDGKITVADIAIINHNIFKNPTPEQYNLDVVPSSVILSKDSNITVEESKKVSDIFTPNTPVTFTGTPNDEGKVEVPLELPENKELSSVELNVPKGSTVTLYNADGEVVGSSTNPATQAIYSTSNEEINLNDSSIIDTYTSEQSTEKVTINLGERKPVKKIVISTDSEGNVVVSDVKLIDNVTPPDFVQDTSIKGVRATAGDKNITLNWQPSENVTGYKVKYSDDINKLNTREAKEATTGDTNITISSLENFKPYYFVVYGTSNTNDNWLSQPSEIVSATPQALSKPNKPDFVSSKVNDKTIELSWHQTKNAKSYNVYMKSKDEQDFKQVGSNIKDLKYKINNLTNGTEYILYVTAVNDIGESVPSDYVSAIPKKEDITAPTLPIQDRIDNKNVVKIEMANNLNVDTSLYPNGFKTEWIMDNNFNTDWVARSFQEPNTFIFTFDQAKTMDYIILAPRLDGEFKNSNKYYTIKVWTKDNLDGEGEVIAKDVEITERFDNNKYYALTFPKTENIQKISIKLGERSGGPRVNISEVAFYEYNNIADRVSNLFANSSRTELRADVNIEEINNLKAEVNKTDSFVVGKDVLLQELDIATSLLENKKPLGIIKNDIFLKSGENIKSINNWQPLGIVASANQKITIFADIPDGNTLQLIPTQYFEEATKLSGSPITLKNGRNTITIPKVGNKVWYQGGSLYVNYSGNNPEKVKLQILGGTDIPYLELSNLNTLSADEAKAKIREFLVELNDYVSKLPSKDIADNFINHSEIALPNVLLSLPANKVLEGIKSGETTSIEAQVEKLYQNCLAWEQVMDVVYTTYGLETPKTGLTTRHNIRYMKMFAGAFMYASGNHIGIGYNSVPGLMNGKPVSSEQSSPNNLFGWGIGHEIGHVMDALGKVEVTNNIYSLMLQTYDGKNNILTSRLEGSSFENSKYKDAFNKVAIGNKGVPNDLFVQLVMYWQLHLAFDDAGEDALNFYNQLHKKGREQGLNLSDINNFAVIASQVANTDLTTFFEKWGVDLSSDATAKMKAIGSNDTRAIYYLNDESRRARLNGNEGNKNIDVTPTATPNPENSKEITITIEPNGTQANVQGYEILRKTGSGEYKGIGFAKADENGKAIFTDNIGAANNLTFKYKVVPVDILGNLSPAKETSEIKISYDNTVNKDLYTIDGNVVTFKNPTIVTGIKITKTAEQPLPQGDYTITGNTKVNGKVQNGLTVKKGNFSTDVNYSKDENTYLTYFNKENSPADKIIPYEVTELTLPESFKGYNVEFLSYPGDNVEFLPMAIGRLGEDYTHLDESLKKDTLVFIGNYRANSITSTVYIKGTYPNNNSLNENISNNERLVAGSGVMLDTLDENGKITASTADGIFIYVPQIQNDKLNPEQMEEQLSQLPTKIKAEIWEGEYGKGRLTSDTLWISMPSEESLPTIYFTQDKNGSSPKIEIR